MSFAHAARGLRTLVATQPNARIHAVATVLVAAAALLLQVRAGDWCWLAAAIAAVWAAEAFNTALEFLADEVSLEHRERIGRAKDLAAAAVLCAAIGAVVIGMLVFVPYLRGQHAAIQPPACLSHPQPPPSTNHTPS